VRRHLAVAVVALATACSPGYRRVEPNMLAYATDHDVRVVDRLGRMRHVVLGVHDVDGELRTRGHRATDVEVAAWSPR